MLIDPNSIDLTVRAEETHTHHGRHTHTDDIRIRMDDMYAYVGRQYLMIGQLYVTFVKS